MSVGAAGSSAIDPSTAVFVDTAFYVALLNPRDELHSSAVAVAGKHTGPRITTEYVLVETGNFLSAPARRAVFGRLWDAIGADDQTRIVPDTSDLLAAGVARFRDRPDKEWSLTDCLSMVVMERGEIDGGADRRPSLRTGRFYDSAIACLTAAVSEIADGPLQRRIGARFYGPIGFDPWSYESAP